MYSKKYLAAWILAAGSTAAFASTAIGTASARGDIRVDGYAINGNATLFDGTAIETSQATATLRLDKGTEIKLGTGSMGTLYRDHLVLQHGKSELATSDSFELEASGFHVIPTEANARGIVAVNGLGGIEVAAISGEFQVTAGSGHVLAKVLPGSAKSFAFQAAGPVTITGTVSQSNGHFYLTDSNGVLHEIMGKNLGKWIGKSVTIDGTIDSQVQATSGAANVIDVSDISKAAGAASAGTGGGPNAGLGGAAAVLVGGTAGIFGIEEGIYQSTKTPASR